MEGSARKICEECGGESVYHRLTYINVVLDGIMRPRGKSNAFTRWLARAIYRVERRATPAILSFFITIGLAKRKDAFDDRTPLLAQMLWKEAEARSIQMHEFRLFDLPRNIYLATFPNGRRIAFEGIPTTYKDLERAPWMDDKARLKEEFRKQELPVAEGGDAFTDHSALSIYRSLIPPVIVKPHTGSGSRHTTLHIKSDLELLRAFHSATRLSPWAVIEEELIGPVFRATVVDGKLAGVLRRDQPHVVGDGRHSILWLVEKANQDPKRDGPYFSRMKFNAATLKELAYQGLTPESVPKKHQYITLHQKVNWSVGGTTADVTDATHADNVALFEEVARATKAPIVGIDFIIADIAQSFTEQARSGVIECNSMPFFDNHHLPFTGEPRNVAGAIWDMVEREYAG